MHVYQVSAKVVIFSYTFLLVPECNLYLLVMIVYFFLCSVLQDNLRKHKMTDMITFVNPAKIGAIGCGTPAARSRALSLRFKNAKPGQVFLLPYHHT